MAKERFSSVSGRIGLSARCGRVDCGPMERLETRRLRLVALPVAELNALAEGDPSVVGATIGPGLVDRPALRAIRMKLEKMRDAPEAEHPWLTYWLVVTHTDLRGVGLLGFKGAPDASGEVEIGYGIAPECRRRGLATEAAARLLQWAFTDPRCTAVRAIGVRNDNVPSQRVLTKLGARRVRCGERASDWRIDAAGLRD